MDCDLLQKIQLLHAAGTHITPPHAQEVVRSFYEILTILDNKGLALLAFDGIIVSFRRRPPCRTRGVVDYCHYGQSYEQ